MPRYAPLRARPRPLPRRQPEPPPSGLEAVAAEVGEWVNVMAHDVAGALMEGDRAPFSPRLTEDKQLAYYADTLFQQDGTVNPAGYAAEQTRIGKQGLARALDAAARWRLARGLPAHLPANPATPVAGGAYHVEGMQG